MTTWRILVVDDDQTVASLTTEALETAPVSTAGETTEVRFTTSFEEALDLLANERFDLVVLDIRDQSSVEPFADAPDDDVTEADVGFDVFEKVRSRRFIPVVFYTAVPNLAADLIHPPFVDVVSKQAEIDELRSKVRAVFDSTLPRIHTELLTHVESVMRDFMSGFVEPHWQELSTPPRKGDIAHLLLRRLALSLADGGELLAGRLEEVPGVELHADSVHPMRYYVTPPVGSIKTGDIIRGPDVIPSVEAADVDTMTDSGWYIILTSACDLVVGRVKAEFIVVARCVPLTETPEYATWRQAPDVGADQTQRKQLETTMRNQQRKNRNADRDFYLPAAWAMPDLLVDFQQLSHVAYSDLQGNDRVATLDSPYAEALIQKLGRYLGRIGTPDLDIQVALSRLEQLSGEDSNQDRDVQ